MFGCIMKTKLQFKKAVFLFTVCWVCSIDLYAQDSYIKNRWNIKTGYARYTNGNRLNNRIQTNGNYRLEVNYGVSDIIEAGFYTGYSKFDSGFTLDKYSAIFYGVNCNLQFLPFLIDESDFRFDFYVTGKLGGLYIASPTNHYSHGNYVEYGIGPGTSFYLSKHIGVFVEYCYGKYYFNDNIKFRYGLSIKF